MAKLLWSLTCQRVITDQETNAASYIDAVEQIRVQGFPAVFVPPLCVTSLWKREGDEDEVLDLRIRLLAPSGKEIASFRPNPVTLSTSRYRMNVLFGGFPIEEEGEYSFEIEVLAGENWASASSLPITVELARDTPIRRASEPSTGPQRTRSR